MLTRIKRIGEAIVALSLALLVVVAIIAAIAGLFWLDKVRFCV